MKLHIGWQKLDLNIHLYDLKQHAISQQGDQECSHGLDDRTMLSPQQDLEHVMDFHQVPSAKRSRELLELIKEEPAEMDDWTTHRTVSPKRTRFQIWTSQGPQL
jgi:hypothetical protein